jgi:hypothetical protein
LTGKLHLGKVWWWKGPARRRLTIAVQQEMRDRRVSRGRNRLQLLLEKQESKLQIHCLGKGRQSRLRLARLIPKSSIRWEIDSRLNACFFVRKGALDDTELPEAVRVCVIIAFRG